MIVYNNRPQTFVAEESAVVIAAVLPSQIASCKIVHNKTPFSFALCYPATVCSGRSQTKAVFVKSAKLRSVSLRGMLILGLLSQLGGLSFLSCQFLLAAPKIKPSIKGTHILSSSHRLLMSKSFSEWSFSISSIVEPPHFGSVKFKTLASWFRSMPRSLARFCAIVRSCASFLP